MRILLLLVSALGFLAACDMWDGACGDIPVLTVASGTYERISGRDIGSYLAGVKHPGIVEWMEVDREADIVRLHGVTYGGEPFVETYRITKATSN